MSGEGSRSHGAWRWNIWIRHCCSRTWAFDCSYIIEFPPFAIPGLTLVKPVRITWNIEVNTGSVICAFPIVRRSSWWVIVKIPADIALGLSLHWTVSPAVVSHFDFEIISSIGGSSFLAFNVNLVGEFFVKEKLEFAISVHLGFIRRNWSSSIGIRNWTTTQRACACKEIWIIISDVYLIGWWYCVIQLGHIGHSFRRNCTMP